MAVAADLDRSIGYAVTFGDTGPADGICNAKDKRIAVAERLEANGRLVALIHELAHALVAGGSRRAAAGLRPGGAERRIGYLLLCSWPDTTANSIPYLTSWAEQASIEVLDQTAALTGRLADRIEGALLAHATGLQPGDQQVIDAPQAVAV